MNSPSIYFPPVPAVDIDSSDLKENDCIEELPASGREENCLLHSIFKSLQTHYRRNLTPAQRDHLTTLIGYFSNTDMLREMIGKNGMLEIEDLLPLFDAIEFNYDIVTLCLTEMGAEQSIPYLTCYKHKDNTDPVEAPTIYLVYRSGHYDCIAFKDSHREVRTNLLFHASIYAYYFGLSLGNAYDEALKTIKSY